MSLPHCIRSAGSHVPDNNPAIGIPVISSVYEDEMPAHKPCVVLDELYRCDFSDMSSEYIDWTGWQIFWIHKMGPLAGDKAHARRTCSIWTFVLRTIWGSVAFAVADHRRSTTVRWEMLLSLFFSLGEGKEVLGRSFSCLWTLNACFLRFSCG